MIGSVKNGAAGVNDINASFHHRLSVGRSRLDGYCFAEGDPIVFLRNDYERELMNGSLGTIIKALSTEGALVADFEGDQHILTGEDLANIELAYAITCHKAQGSQFKRVAIPVVRSRLLDHALIYTALTRGVEQVVSSEMWRRSIALSKTHHEPVSGKLRLPSKRGQGWALVWVAEGVKGPPGSRRRSAAEGEHRTGEDGRPMPVLDAWSVGRSPVTLSSKVMGGIIPSPASPRRRGRGLGRSPMGRRLSATSGPSGK